MPHYQNLQNELFALLETLKGPNVPYALTYAKNLVTATQQFPREPGHAANTQLLYLVGNLAGVPDEDLARVEDLLKRHGYKLAPGTPLAEAFQFARDETEEMITEGLVSPPATPDSSPSG